MQKTVRAVGGSAGPGLALACATAAGEGDPLVYEVRRCEDETRNFLYRVTVNDALPLARAWKDAAPLARGAGACPYPSQPTGTWPP